MAEKVVGRVDQNGNLKVLGELDESNTNNNPMAYDANGNLLVGGELIEVVRAGSSSVLTYKEDTQTDFNSGTLLKTIGKSDGTLQLAGENTTGYPNVISGTGGTGQYGIGFTVNEPVILNGWKSNIASALTINVAVFDNYTWGQNLTGLTPYLQQNFNYTAGVNTVTGLNWYLPKGTYWLGLTTSTTVTMYRNNTTGSWGTHPATSAGGCVTSIKACRMDGYTVGQDNWYYFWEWELKKNTSGNRVSPAYDLSSITNVQSATISWNANIPTGSTFSIETSLDGGNVWTYVGDIGSSHPIPNINIGDNLTGKTLMIRESLNIGTATSSPMLQDITVNITQAGVDTSGITIQLDGSNLKVADLEEGVTLI